MYHIVIADDEAYIRDLVAKSINNAGLGMEVVGCAEDGTSAIEMIKEQKPDILITDICMPLLSGLDLIKQVKETGVNLKTVIISGYDDFIYAKTAIQLGVTNYLLKPFLPGELFEVLEKIKEELDNNASLQRNMTELQNQFEDNVLLIQEKFLKDIIQNTAGKKNLIEEGRTLRLDLGANYYCTGIVRIHSESAVHKSNLENQNVVGEFLIVTKDKYFEETVKTYAVSLKDNQLAILFCSRHMDIFEFNLSIKNSIEKINSSLIKYYNMQLVCVLGKIYPKLEQAANSYEEALSVFKYIIPEGNCVIHYDEARQIKDAKSIKNQKKPMELKEELILNIRLAKKEKALTVLESILEYYESLFTASQEFVSLSIFELVFSIDNVLLESGSTYQVWQDVNMKKYFKDQILGGTLLDTKILLENYVSKRCEEFSSIIANQGDKLVYDIKTLIDHNLGNEAFNLENASSRLFFSPNYIRQLFKQKTGEGFMEYLIRRRMERAGELLKDPLNKIQDVSAGTGYSNQRYFSSCFKKFYGCTPTEYREEMLKKQKTVSSTTNK